MTLVITVMSMDLLESVDMDIPNSYIDMDMSAAMSAKEESEEEEEEVQVLYFCTLKMFAIP